MIIQTKKEHLSYIDVCKAIGIILVVFGHTYGIPEVLYNIIYSFHMPLFFVIAGIVYNENKYDSFSFKNFLLLKFKTYVIPYICFGIINLILQIFWNLFILRQEVSIDFIFHNLKGIAICWADVQHMPNCSPIWFLLALFIASVIFWAIIKYLKRFSLWLSAFCMLCSYGIYILQKYQVIKWFIPWNFPASLMAVFFMYIGYAINKHNIIEKVFKAKHPYVILIAALVLGIPAAVFNGKNVGMNGNFYGNLFLFLLASVSLSVLLMLLSHRIKPLQNRFLIWLGKNTMFIIGFNYFLRDLTTEIYYLIPFVRNFKLHWSVSFILTTLGSIVGILLYNKTKDLVRSVRKKHKQTV